MAQEKSLEAEVEKLSMESIASGTAMAALAGLRRNALVICLLAAAGLVSGITYLRFADQEYDIFLTVTPVSGESSSPRSLSGLASLAGVSLPIDSGRATFDLYLGALQSRAAADLLAQDVVFLRRVFSSEWSKAKGRWEEPESVFGDIKFALLQAIGGHPVPWAPPSSDRLHQFIVNAIDIERDDESPLVTVSFRTSDRVMGRELLWRLHKAVDAMLRERALKRSTAYSQYLSDKLARVTVAEYRSSLVAALSAQERLRMMASSSVPFVADPFGVPVTSPEPVTPNASIVLLVFTFIGFMFGCISAVIFDHLKRRPNVIR